MLSTSTLCCGSYFVFHIANSVACSKYKLLQLFYLFSTCKTTLATKTKLGIIYVEFKKLISFIFTFHDNVVVVARNDCLDLWLRVTIARDCCCIMMFIFERRLRGLPKIVAAYNDWLDFVVVYFCLLLRGDCADCRDMWLRITIAAIIVTIAQRLLLLKDCI